MAGTTSWSFQTPHSVILRLIVAKEGKWFIKNFNYFVLNFLAVPCSLYVINQIKGQSAEAGLFN